MNIGVHSPLSESFSHPNAIKQINTNMQLSRNIARECAGAHVMNREMHLAAVRRKH